MLLADDRKHLTSKEVEQLLQATKGSRNEARDRCLLLVTFRHGLRVTETCRLKLDQVDARQPLAARHPAEAWAVDRPALARRRAAGDLRLCVDFSRSG